MPRIFISYRREDSKHAVGRLHAALARHVRNPKRDIFIDIDNIPRGVDFVDHLDGQVAQCDVMLAVIGPGWLAATDAKTGRRRLDDPHDFVRIEVASALKRGIPVVPVVLDDTKIPVAGDLPDDLRLLARRNGERLEHESFAADVARLIKNLPTSDARSAVTASRVVKPAAGGGGWIAPVVALGILVIGGGGAAAWMLDLGGLRSSLPTVMADPPSGTPAGTTSATHADSAAEPTVSTLPSTSTSVSEVGKIAAPLVGKWAGTGLTCQDALTIKVSEDNLVLEYGNTPSSEKIEGVEPDGSIRTRSNGASIFYRVNNQTLSLRSPDGSTATFTRCADQ